MIIVMGVSLFTVRIVLNALGITDYGIYNVVGGITALFVFLSNTMAHASQRFFAFELGRKDDQALKAIFNTNMTIYALISLIVLILTETIGLWFLNTKMIIPPERIVAANWIYQFSILSFLASMFSTPYKAVILAREKMSIFAYISIIEVLAKLLVAYLMIVVIYDKLKFYAILHFFVIGGISLSYILFCTKRYAECRFAFSWDKQNLAKILSYTGWSFYGHAAMSLRGQGINIILNLFFGPIVNAARGVAFQVDAAISNFYTSFFTAVKPQIIKLYAQGNNKEMLNLIYRSSRFCYFLVLIVAVPVLLETPYILKLWLVDIPDYTILFTRIIIATTMIDSITLSLSASADATGNIRNYQLIIGSILLMNVPLCWLVLKLGFPPQSAMYVVLGISIVILFIKTFFARKMVNLSIKAFFNKVIFTIMIVTLVSFLAPIIIVSFINSGFFRLCITIATTLSWSAISIFLIGLSKNEKSFFISVIKKKIKSYQL